jgi:hypothetical protein
MSEDGSGAVQNVETWPPEWPTHLWGEQTRATLRSQLRVTCRRCGRTATVFEQREKVSRQCYVKFTLDSDVRRVC